MLSVTRDGAEQNDQDRVWGIYRRLSAPYPATQTGGPEDPTRTCQLLMERRSKVTEWITLSSYWGIRDTHSLSGKTMIPGFRAITKGEGGSAEPARTIERPKQQGTRSTQRQCVSKGACWVCRFTDVPSCWPWTINSFGDQHSTGLPICHH